MGSEMCIRDRYRATGLSKPRTYLFLKNDCTSDNLYVEGHKVNWPSFPQDRKREAKHSIFSYLSTRSIVEYIYDG